MIKTTRDLSLTTYNTADDIFHVLENHFGNQTSIALDIVEKLQRIPAVRGHAPRKTVERPGRYRCHKETSHGEWVVYAADKQNGVVPGNHFDSLLTEQKSFMRSLNN